ncbi:MAG: prepilin-type N-terminal cleavage/methylation protein [Candidatus Saccharibacteria bacterium]|nr:prepilin-type N-terminal cleavage/methylation protein [Candidatus Saccharibacteria bacterium]
MKFGSPHLPKKIQTQKGFTIVELLIVIVIIGILAAITIVAFNGIRDRAVTAAIQSDLAMNSRVLGQYQAINSSFPVDDTVVDLKNSNGNIVTYVPAPDLLSYCLQIVNGSKAFRISNASGTPEQALCASSTASFASITSTSFVLNWTAVSGATGYSARCARDAGYTTGLVTQTTTGATTSTFSSLTAGTAYFCSVMSSIGSASSDWSATVTTSTAAPAVPGSLASSAITVNAFTFSWGAVAGAVGYTAQCATSTAYTTLVHNSSPAGTSVSVTGLSGATSYFCRVLARGTSSNSANSTNLTVTTSTPATPGSFASSAITATTFTLSWAASTGAIGYNAQCSTDSTFATTNFTSSPAGTSVSVTGMTASTTYYCRVQARGTNTNSAFTTNLTVVTTP